MTGQELLSKANAWCEERDVPLVALALRADVDVTTLYHLARGEPSERTINALRAAMADPSPVAYAGKRRAKILYQSDVGYRGPVPEAQRVERDPCPWCAVRRDVGCRHFPQVRAA